MVTNGTWKQPRSVQRCVQWRHTHTVACLSDTHTNDQVVWECGLLRKQGMSLCHGVAGNAYAFLALHRAAPDATRRQRYLHRARQFARLLLAGCSPGAVVKLPSPDLLEYAQAAAPVKAVGSGGVACTEGGLMEGAAGVVCLLFDVLNPDKAWFPGFEVPEG